MLQVENHVNFEQTLTKNGIFYPNSIISTFTPNKTDVYLFPGIF